MSSWLGCDIAHGNLVGQRETYEDRSLAMRFPSGSGPMSLHAAVAVADGMGGHSAGDVAAQAATDAIRELLVQPDGKPLIDSGPGDLATAMREAVSLANSRIFSRAEAASVPTQMGTTVTFAGILQDRVVVAHVGDSRAYSIRHDRIEQITRDHSWVAEQVRAGTMTAEEARRSPLRNQITRTVGTNRSVEPDIVEMPLQGDEVILVCSDGLVECLRDTEIHSIVKSAGSIEDAVRKLLQAAQKADPQDNVTISAVEIGVFFKLYGNDSSRNAITAGIDPGQLPVAPRARSSHQPWVLAVALIAAFGLGMLARLGWAAWVGGEEPAAVEQLQVAGEPATPEPDAPEITDATAGVPAAVETTVPDDGLTAARVILDDDEGTFVIELLDGLHHFEPPRIRDGMDARLDDSGTRITYTFRSPKNIRSLGAAEASLSFKDPTDDTATFRWLTGSESVMVPRGNTLTCWYDSKESRVHLFDFQIVPVAQGADPAEAGHP
jgi:serine/threonine protein phosphatase PrpC